MKLTRRDALAALAGIGTGTTLALEGERVRTSSDPESLEPHVVETMVAIAHVVYPGSVSGVDAFVRTFVEGHVDRHPELAEDLSAVVEAVDEIAVDRHGVSVVDLDGHARDRLLRDIGVDSADPEPDGTIAERVRHLIVNELLFALFTSPAGGELVGIENPQGHPGGLDSYRRGPRG